ncbi:MAG: hypothetical protein IV100_07355 [Myxococcales bacterium]|nr:hypothetical protein [Myxococcales bacterium]
MIGRLAGRLAMAWLALGCSSEATTTAIADVAFEGPRADTTPSDPVEDVAPPAPDTADDVLGLVDDVAAMSDTAVDIGEDVADASLPPDPAAPPALPSEPIGAGLCVSDVPRTGPGQTFATTALGTLGARWVRLELIWAELEPSDGDFHPEGVDERVDPYHTAGVQVLANLGYGNAWATTAEGADSFYPPDDLSRFADYVGAVVAHVKDRVQRFEIWNEPNAGYRFWKPTVSGDPAAFAELLTLATTAGRASCPACTFAFGAPFFHEQIIDGHLTFLTKAQAAHPGLASSYDAMGFHPYPLYPPAAPPEGPAQKGELPFEEMARGIRALMAADGPVRPLWGTELGWPVFGPVTASRQAAYLTRAMLGLTALGVTPRCWFNLDDGPNFAQFPPEDAFGLYTWADPPTLKPAGKAFALLGHRFAEHRITAALAAPDVPEGVTGYVLQGPTGERVWAVWAFPSEGPLAVTLPAAATEAIDAVGESVIGAPSAVELPRFYVLSE